MPNFKKTITLALGTTIFASTMLAGTSNSIATTALFEEPPTKTLEQENNLEKWGVKILPVPEKMLLTYKMKPKHIDDIISSQRWRERSKVKHIRQRESGGNYNINTGNGYYGAYQFAYGTWLANGGGRFARIASEAPKWAQDYIAYKTWKAAGWAPWGG